MKTNKERITLNFRLNPVVPITQVNDIIDKLNNKKFGRKIDLHDIIADFINNHTEKDIARIQNTATNAMDRVKIKYEKDMEKSGKKISFEDYVAKKLKV